MACSVITVLGADVPDGSALTSSIGGLARQERGGHGSVAGCAPGWKRPLGLALKYICILDSVSRPGRMVRTSASRLTCAAVMPNARSSWGVAT